MAQINPQDLAAISTMPVARLATADNRGVPHVIPICFAYDGTRFYSVLDQKPKGTSLMKLKRVRNILSNPNVTLLLDHYEEDWARLWYVLVSGTAQLIHEGEEHRRAIGLLRKKYPQYRHMDIDSNPIITITARDVTSWRTFRQGGERGQP